MTTTATAPARTDRRATVFSRSVVTKMTPANMGASIYRGSGVRVAGHCANVNLPERCAALADVTVSGAR
jgi:hypothetical protein